MAPAHFAYVVLYVPDVSKALEFYSKAFGLEARREDRHQKWAELETGATTLAFTPYDQRETEIVGGVQEPGMDKPAQNVQIAFNVDDVHAVFKHAVSVGATPVAEPEDKIWNQTVGYLRDPFGIVVRLGGPVNEGMNKEAKGYGTA